MYFLKLVLIIFFVTSTISLRADNNQSLNAELEYSWRHSASYYGVPWGSFRYHVLIENSDSKKEVYISRKMGADEWKDIKLVKVLDTIDGKELWFGGRGVRESGGDFYIKVIQDSIVHKFDNNGNYFRHGGIGLMVNPIAGVRVATFSLETVEYPDKKRIEGLLGVYNHSFDKDITIVYSTDQWATRNEIKARWAGDSVLYDYALIDNPHRFNNTEIWKIQFDLPKHIFDVEFFVKYTVDNQTFYDSYYGHNYYVAPYKSFTEMNIRTSNNWDDAGIPMRHTRYDRWVADLNVESDDFSFKFDAFNNWESNFGDFEGDGFIDRGGYNIPLEKGRYRVHLDMKSHKYRVEPIN